MDELRKAHDALLKGKPEEAVHDEEACPFCNDKLIANYNPTEGGDMNYTEEEFNAAVADAVVAAVTSVQAELDSLRASLAEEEVDTRVAEAKAEGDARVAELQSELDDAGVKLAVAEQIVADISSFLEAEAEAAALAIEIEDRKVTRRAAIAEIVKFDEAHIEANIDRWAEKSDEDFADLLEGWKAIASKPVQSEESTEITEIPETAMSHTREESKSASPFTDVLNARLNGVDIHARRNDISIHNSY